MPTTIDSLEEAINGVRLILTEIQGMLREQNGRQRENTSAIIRIVEAAAALTNVVENQVTLTREQAAAIHAIESSSGRWSKGLAITQAVLALAMVYVGMFRS